MIPLKQISVPSPCPARWDDMDGDAQTRFCTGCRKDVFNLSEMSRREGEGLLTRTEAKVCVFFYPDADGAPLPREEVPMDFPLASRARPSVWRRAGAAALSGLAAVALAALGGGAAQAVTHPSHGTAPHSQHGKPGVRQRIAGHVVRLVPPKAPPATRVPLGGKPAIPPPPPRLLGGAPMALPPPHK